MWWLYLVSSVLGYLLGSIPTGFLIGRAHGIDIREHGSKNMGATNVVRVLGKKPGYFVFFCDAVKGGVAVSVGRLLIMSEMFRQTFRAVVHVNGALGQNGMEAMQLAAMQAATFSGILAGLACILGHNFPVWLRFKGGKGVATTLGVLLGLMPAAVGVSAVVWFITYYLSRYVSLASLLGAAVLPVSVWFLTVHQETLAGPPWLFYFSLLAATLIFWRHRSNIRRLLNGTESKFARKSSASPPP